MFSTNFIVLTWIEIAKYNKSINYLLNMVMIKVHNIIPHLTKKLNIFKNYSKHIDKSIE